MIYFVFAVIGFLLGFVLACSSAIYFVRFEQAKQAPVGPRGRPMTGGSVESDWGAFEAAFVSLMAYYNHFRGEQAAEIDRLRAENERLRADLAELRSAVVEMMPAQTGRQP